MWSSQPGTGMQMLEVPFDDRDAFGQQQSHYCRVTINSASTVNRQTQVLNDHHGKTVDEVVRWLSEQPL